MLIVQFSGGQFGAAPGAIAPIDPVDALVTCVADPVACRPNFTQVLIDVTPSEVPADRRVLELIGEAFDHGPQGGANPFYRTSFAADVVRIHADADPDLAADLLIVATNALLRDATAAQLSQGPDGFFAHAIDGIIARLLIWQGTSPADLRALAIAALRNMAASTFLDTAQRARTALARLGESVVTLQIPVPTPSAAATKPLLSPRAKIGAIALGIGAVAAASIAFFIGKNAHESKPEPVFGKRKRRRRYAL